MDGVPHVNKKFSSASFSDFQEIKELYRSGAGAVFCARFKYDKKKYVLKERTLPELGKRKDMMNEVNLLTQLDHPNVVRCEGYFRDESRKSLFIVLEFCKDGDLKTMLDKHKAEKKKLDEKLIWHIFHQLCHGVKHLHEHGIVHRDLKTMNVMIVKDERRFTVKIADLGVSRQISDDTMMLQTFYGTPLYLSPELVENKAYNEKTDIWSLGVILYELCTQRHPFMSNTLIGLAKRIVAGKFDPIPSRYSSELSRSVKWMLKTDFTKRPNSVQLIKFTESQLTPPGYPWKAVSGNDEAQNKDSDRGIFGKGKLEILVGDEGGERGGEDAGFWKAPGTADTAATNDSAEEFDGTARRRGANLSGAGDQPRPGTAGDEIEQEGVSPPSARHTGPGRDQGGAKKPATAPQGLRPAKSKPDGTNASKSKSKNKSKNKSESESSSKSSSKAVLGAAERALEKARQEELESRFGTKLGHDRLQKKLIREERDSDDIVGESAAHHDRSHSPSASSPKDTGSDYAYARPAGDEALPPPVMLTSLNDPERLRAREPHAVRPEYKKYAVFDLKAKEEADRMEPVAGVGGWAADGSDFPSMEEVDAAAADLERDGNAKHALKKKKDGEFSPRREEQGMVVEEGHLMGSPREPIKGSYPGKLIPRRPVPDPDGGVYGASKLHTEGGSMVGSEHHQKKTDSVLEARRHRARLRALPNKESEGHDDQAHIDRHYNAHREERRVSLPNRESDNDDARYTQRHYDAHRAERASSLPNRESDDAYLHYAAEGGTDRGSDQYSSPRRKARVQPEIMYAAGKETPSREEVGRSRHRSESHKAQRDGSLQVHDGHLVSSPSQSPRSSARAKAMYSPKAQTAHPQDREEQGRANNRARGEYHPGGDKGDPQLTGVHPQDKHRPEKPSQRRSISPPTAAEQERRRHDGAVALAAKRRGHLVANEDSQLDDQAHIDRHYNAHREERRVSLPNRESDNDDARYTQRHYDAHRAERARSLPNRESDDAFLNYAARGEEAPSTALGAAPAPAPAPDVRTLPEKKPEPEAAPASAVPVDSGMAGLLLKKELRNLRRLRKMKDFLGLSEGHGTHGVDGQTDAASLLKEIEACRSRIRELEQCLDRHWMEVDKLDSFPKLRSRAASPERVIATADPSGNSVPRRAAPRAGAGAGAGAGAQGPGVQEEEPEPHRSRQEAQERHYRAQRKAEKQELIEQLEERRGRAGPGREGVHADALGFKRGERALSPDKAPEAFHDERKSVLFERDINIKPQGPTLPVARAPAQAPPTAIAPARPSSGKPSSTCPPAYHSNSNSNSDQRRGSLVPFQKAGVEGRLLPGDAGRHEHEPEAAVSHLIQQDGSKSPRRHTVSRHDYRSMDDANSVNARYGVDAHAYQNAVLRDEEEAKRRRMSAIKGFRDGVDRPFTAAAAARVGYGGRSDHDNSHHPAYQQRQELREREAREHNTAGTSPREENVSRPRQIPRRRDVRNEELYEPAGLMVKGLFKGFEREVGTANNHYASKDRLPPADGLSEERAAAVDMFGFNANKTPRFHRQAPVSSGAAFLVKHNKPVELQEGELKIVTGRKIRSSDGMHDDEGGFRLW